MKLPIKYNHQKDDEINNIQIDEIDGFGGASSLGIIYVKECKQGKIIKKSEAVPYRRGIINKKIVFYYLKKGDSPPVESEMIPSIWS